MALGVLAAALAVTGLAHLPRRAPPAPAAVPVPAVDLALEIRDGAVHPTRTAVPKDHRVRLVVTNRGARPVRLRLAGYEAAVAVDSLAPGSAWRTEFLSALPGDDFAWTLDGVPAGRLEITGSHLIEGHR